MRLPGAGGGSFPFYGGTFARFIFGVDKRALPHKYCKQVADPPILSCWISLCVCFLKSFCYFPRLFVFVPFFSKDFGGSARKTLVLLVVFLAFYHKSKGWRVREPGLKQPGLGTPKVILTIFVVATLEHFGPAPQSLLTLVH